jgi:glycosyltransferase involved in cell wall biosynthesis
MKIGVELFQIREGESGGLYPFLQGLLGSLLANERTVRHEVVLFCTCRNEAAFRKSFPQTPLHVLPTANYFPALDGFAASLGIDVLFRSYPFITNLAFPLRRQVVLIPDIQHEYFPSFFTPEVLLGRRAAFAQALQEAGAVITLSEHARQTLLAQSLPGADIFVTSPALAPGTSGTEPLTEKDQWLLPTGKYFFFPANLWPHKNHRRLLEAFRLFLERTGQSVQLILTGHPEGWQALGKECQDLPVHHLGYVSRPLLRALTEQATALVFFTLFEGFGMPLLEAFRAGTPVLCSNTTSLPEVGGDAVVTCDPTEVGAMADAMARIVENPALRTGLIERGKEQLARYTWEETTAQFTAACEHAMAQVPLPADQGMETVSKLNEVVKALEEDGANRLEAIHRLDAALKLADSSGGTGRQSELLAEARRSNRQLKEELKISEEDRAARLVMIEQLTEMVHTERKGVHFLTAAVQRLEATVAELDAARQRLETSLFEAATDREERIQTIQYLVAGVRGAELEVRTRIEERDRLSVLLHQTENDRAVVEQLLHHLHEKLNSPAFLSAQLIDSLGRTLRRGARATLARLRQAASPKRTA